MSAANTVQEIRSLRKELREPSLPISTIRALEVVHGYLKTGTDSQGWRRVDWKPRGGHGGHGGGGRGGYGGAAAPPVSFDRRSGGAPGKAAGAGAAGGSTAAPPAVFTSPPVRYVSKFKAAATPDKVDDTILNTIILGKLNKFSVGNYAEIYEFLCQILDSGQTDFLKHFMLLVFEKAAAEEVFCPLYAKLLSELSSKYTILHGEMTALYGEYLKIFEEVDESSAADYDDFVKRTEQKKYRLGYSQFLAELIKHGTVDIDLFMRTIQTIIRQLGAIAVKADNTRIVEEYADCILRITRAVKTCEATAGIVAIRAALGAEEARIRPFTAKNPDNKSLSNKARFTLMDICDAIGRF